MDLQRINPRNKLSNTSIHHKQKAHKKLHVKKRKENPNERDFFMEIAIVCRDATSFCIKTRFLVYLQLGA